MSKIIRDTLNNLKPLLGFIGTLAILLTSSLIADNLHVWQLSKILAIVSMCVHFVAWIVANLAFIRCVLNNYSMDLQTLSGLGSLISFTHLLLSGWWIYLYAHQTIDLSADICWSIWEMCVGLLIFFGGLIILRKETNHGE